ncbi:MAG: N-acetylmuramate 1-kinase [Variibacter sp.]|nr:N-acetylmuramate 1-kinase [Variibacter sp.]
MLTSADAPAYERRLADEDGTIRLAQEIAALAQPDDVIALSGDLGSGKTTFARAFIRALAGDPNLEVPSPTFTLVQSYDLPRCPVIHIDLYRANSTADLEELGFPEVCDGAITLIEWPEKAEDLLPHDRLDVGLSLSSDESGARDLRLKAHGSIGVGVERLFALDALLLDAEFATAVRERMQGDASTRIYERLRRPDLSAILMNAPRRPDGPPVRDGKPYSAIAHLAEDVKPFVALARGLRDRGFSSPKILAADLEHGLLILEDLGTEPVVESDPPAPIEERYTAALDVLVALHREPLPENLPIAPGLTHSIPRYDLDAQMIEVELLFDWYLAQQDAALGDDAREEFVSLWTEALLGGSAAPSTWVLRDYHSPNLLWLPDREGISQVGLLDFQDAVIGPAAYDVVSLLQDARVDIPQMLEDSLFRRYIKARHAADRAFDMGQFGELYALMGAQRATKILGIFARLQRRDGKPQYLRHQPRVHRNLRRSLSHPILRGLKKWYDAHVPPPRP